MTFIDALDEPLLAELYRYWCDRRQQRFAPARADIDPVDIPQLLPYIALSEIIQDDASGTQRIRYRLAGTQIEAHFGCGLTNRYLDELKFGDYLRYILDLYDRLIADKAPVYSESSYGEPDGKSLSVKRLMLPLSENGTTVTMVLAGLLYSSPEPGCRTTVLHAQTRFSAARLEGR